MESKALMTLPEAQMIERINMARFPQDLKPADKKVLAQAAITYGFDPLMAEISLYQGRPYISIDGRYRKAQESGKLDGVETRPATKEERETWDIPEGDLFYRSEVFVKEASHPFVGWGRVFAREMKGNPNLPIVSNSQRMAEKRAEAQALRKAFHIPLPSIEDIGVEEGEPAQTITVTVVEPEEKAPAKAKPAPEPTKSKSEPVKPAEAPEAPEQAEAPAEQREELGELASRIDPEWLKETLELIHWKPATALSWIAAQCKIEVTDKLETTIAGLTDADLKKFVDHLTAMREVAGG